MPQRRIWTVVGGSLLVVALASCGGGSDDKATKGSTTSSSSTTSTSGPGPSTTSPSTPAPPAPPPSNNPQITSFNTSQSKAQCTQSDSPSATISWSTSNVNQTTLSVDGPGVYGTYGPSGSVTVGAACPPPSQSQSHTYTLTAKGPGGQVQKTVTLQFFGIPV